VSFSPFTGVSGKDATLSAARIPSSRAESPEAAPRRGQRYHVKG